MNKKAGFTLTELMVVIAILALLAAFGIPNFMAWLPKHKLNSAADELVSTLQLSKLRAIREHTNVAVTFDFVNNTYLAFLDNGANPGNGIREADEIIIKTGRMPAGIDLQNTGLGALVQFNRRGFPDVSGNIAVSHTSGARVINLTLAGSVNIQYQ